MAEVFFDSDIFTNGKIKLSTVPNATGTVMTYNSATKELSTRTNAQIISDLGLEGGGLTFYMTKSTQNIVKSADWFITDDYSTGMEGKISFQNGMVKIGWDSMSMLFTDEGAIDLTGYGIRQNDATPNHFVGYAQFFGRAGFPATQGTSPFDVTSTTVVTNLNADLLDGRHASDFMLSNQAGNYIDKASTNIVLTDNWMIKSNTQFDNGYFKFTGTYGYPEIGIGQSSIVFSDENSIWLTNFGISQQTGQSGNNYLYSDTYFNYVNFTRAQGTSPFEVTSNTLVTNLNADYLDGYHASSFAQASQLGNYVPTAITITIDGVTQDLSTDRSWTTNNTITRLRGGGSFVSGDITLNAGANTIVSQSGQTITIASTDTNTTYTAGSGLTLSGTTFSLPVTITGTGNGVASVTQDTNGIAVTKTDFATTAQLGNFVTVTGAAQNITSAKTFDANVIVTQGTVLNGARDINGGWVLNNDQNGGEYGMYPQDNQNDLIAGIEGNSFVFGTTYNTKNGIAIDRATKNVNIGVIDGPNKVNVNGAVQANGLVANGTQSPTLAWTTDGGTFDLTAVSGKITQQYILVADSSGFVPTIPTNVDLISIYYKPGGTGNNSKIFLPKNARTGQEVTIMNNSDYETIVCNQNTPLDILGIQPKDALRFIFVLDTFPVGSVAEDRVGDGSWVMINHFKDLRVFL